MVYRLLCPWDSPRQEYWSDLPFPSPGDLPNPGIEPGPLALQDEINKDIAILFFFNIMLLLKECDKSQCTYIERSPRHTVK